MVRDSYVSRLLQQLGCVRHELLRGLDGLQCFVPAVSRTSWSPLIHEFGCDTSGTMARDLRVLPGQAFHRCNGAGLRVAHSIVHHTPRSRARGQAMFSGFLHSPILRVDETTPPTRCRNCSVHGARHGREISLPTARAHARCSLLNSAIAAAYGDDSRAAILNCLSSSTHASYSGCALNGIDSTMTGLMLR